MHKWPLFNLFNFVCLCVVGQMEIATASESVVSLMLKSDIWMTSWITQNSS
jgi:hypothetical protein